MERRARADGSHSMYQKTNQEKKGGQANKNRPMEVSSKKPVGRFGEVIQAPKNANFGILGAFARFVGKVLQMYTIHVLNRCLLFLMLRGLRREENNLPTEEEEQKKHVKKCPTRILHQKKNKCLGLHRCFRKQSGVKLQFPL